MDDVVEDEFHRAVESRVHVETAGGGVERHIVTPMEAGEVEW